MALLLMERTTLGNSNVRGVRPFPGHFPRRLDQSTDSDLHDQQSLSDGPGENNIIGCKRPPSTRC